MDNERLQGVTLAERLAAEAKDWDGVTLATLGKSESERLHALLAEAAAALSVRGWQDIASAPKDGTLVLLGGGTYEANGMDGLPHKVSIAHWSRLHGHWHGNEANAHDEYCVVQPTHWQPLPATPPAPDAMNG